MSEREIAVMTFADLIAEFETVDEAVDFIIGDVLKNPELYRGDEMEMFAYPGGPAHSKLRSRLRLVVLDDGGDNLQSANIERESRYRDKLARYEAVVEAARQCYISRTTTAPTKPQWEAALTNRLRAALGALDQGSAE